MGDTKKDKGSTRGAKSSNTADGDEDDSEEDEEDDVRRKSGGGDVGAHVKRSDGMEMEVTFVSGEMRNYILG